MPLVLSFNTGLGRCILQFGWVSQINVLRAYVLNACAVIFIAFIFLVNLLGVRVFGELEFWFSSIKGQSMLDLCK